VRAFVKSLLFHPFRTRSNPRRRRIGFPTAPKGPRFVFLSRREVSKQDIFFLKCFAASGSRLRGSSMVLEGLFGPRNLSVTPPLSLPLPSLPSPFPPTHQYSPFERIFGYKRFRSRLRFRRRRTIPLFQPVTPPHVLPLVPAASALGARRLFCALQRHLHSNSPPPLGLLCVVAWFALPT